MTRVLAIGSDRSVFNQRSEGAKRQTAYGTVLGELHIVVFSRVRERLSARPLSAEVHAYPTQSRLRLLYGWDAFWLQWKLPRPDVVTVQDPFEAGLIGWVVARLRRATFHVQLHTDFFAPAFAESIVNRMRIRIARFVLRRADRIRVVTRRLKENIETRIAPKAPIAILPIFIDIERYRHAHAGPLAGRFSMFNAKLLVVARLEPEKNVALAIDAFAKATSEKVCLIIVGDGSERKKLEKLAARLGVAERVFFEGLQDAAPYYVFASLVMVPSKFEGYGRVIIEAFAAGKPVLSTDVGVAHDAGATVSSPENFSDALIGWLENGSREAALKDYPYASFDEYVAAYCADMIGGKPSLP